jgi:osmotically-inducible protein OsmY
LKIRDGCSIRLSNVARIAHAIREEGGSMAIETLSQVDLRMRDAVSKELAWDSEVDATAIGVAARDGAVTLTGFIDSYAGKLAAERAAKRIRGVRAVANDLQVRLRLDRTDEDLARDAAWALEFHGMELDHVQATVHQGLITLTGTVPSMFKRTVAENAVKHIKGVRHVINRVDVVPTASLADVQQEITLALHRRADVDAHAIEVVVTGNRVRLTGTVNSWSERQAAEEAASHAPGVTVVINELGVRMNEESADDQR